MTEIKAFQNVFEKFIPLFENVNYKKGELRNYNENDSDAFTVITLYNHDLQKSVAFTFYPLSSKIIQGQISVNLAKSDGSTLDLANFLAYRETRKTIDYSVRQQYVFKISPVNTMQSIELQLQKIIDLLFNEFRPYFLENDWLNIPIKDPRDDY